MREAKARSRSPGLAGDRRKGFPIFRIGNQIADFVLAGSALAIAVAARRSTASGACIAASFKIM
jgi:hypothetical protein